MDPFEFLVENGINPGGMSLEQATREAERIIASRKVRPSGELQPAFDTLEQLGTGLLETPQKLLYGLGADIAGSVEGPLRALGVGSAKPKLSPALELRRLAEDPWITDVTGTPPPKNFAERVARAGVAAPVQVVSEGLEALKALGMPAEPPVDMDRAALEAPGIAELMETGVAPQALIRKVTPETPSTEPQISEATPQVPDPIEGPVMVETPAGPVPTTREEWLTLGVLGAASLAAAFVPGTRGRLHLGLPKPKKVQNAHPATKGLSTRVDLARTFDDVNAGVMRLAERAGMPKSVLDQLDKMFDIHTRAAASSLGDSAIGLGRMDTIGMRYRAPSLYELGLKDTPEVRAYLKLFDTLDELQIPKNMRINPNNPNVNAAIFNAMAGPKRTRVRGKTEQQVLAEINHLERVNPELRPIHKAYLDNLKETRRFASEGEFAILSKRKKRELDVTHRHSIPAKQRVLGEELDQGSPFAILSREVKTTLRKRMENEVRGRYIDELRKINHRYARKVTAKQLKDNPHWGRNTLTVWRRGKREHYSTDPLIADVLKFDPYTFKGDPIHSATRFFESATTGVLAPFFAFTNSIRAYRTGKMTTGEGWDSPTILGSLSAIPEQLIPQLANSIRISVDGAAPILSQVFGSNAVQGLSLSLARVWDQSLFAQVAQRGSVRAPYQAQATETAISQLRAAASSGKTSLHLWLGGYKSLVNAIHGAPQFNFIKRNQFAFPLDEVMRQARQLTGDPRMGGQEQMGGAFSGRPIRSNKGGMFKNIPVERYGAVTEFGRRYVPWYNQTVQSMKRIGEAYVKNPPRFVMNAWLYGIMPAAALYFYNRALSQTDEAKERGWDYSEYQNRGRSPYATHMESFIGKPGSPPEEGIRLPRVHEMAFMERLAEVALDHLFRRPQFTAEEDMLQVAQSFLDIVAEPPMPVPLAVGIGAAGMNPPMGVMGGEVFEPPREGFVNDQWPVSIDTITRALGGALAAVVGDGFAAYTSNNEDDLAGRVRGAILEMGASAVKRAPLLRDVLGFRHPRSGSTETTDEVHAIDDQLDKFGERQGFLKKWDEGQGRINTDLPLGTDVAKLEEWLGGPVPEVTEEPTGVLPAPPTNPIYLAFGDQIYKNFFTQGGDKEGYDALWKIRGIFSQKIDPLKRVNHGNLAQWRRELEGRPHEIAYLKGKGVDHTSPLAVQNWYEGERFRVTQQLYRYIKEAEDQMTGVLQEFKTKRLDLLDPNEADFTPEQLNLWVILKKTGQTALDLPDEIKLKDLSPY